jgi:hypothetical protein
VAGPGSWSGEGSGELDRKISGEETGEERRRSQEEGGEEGEGRKGGFWQPAVTIWVCVVFHPKVWGCFHPKVFSRRSQVEFPLGEAVFLLLHQLFTD